MGAERLPLSVWPVTQRTSRSQRRGRYLPEAIKHPAKMLPALARRAVEAYSASGDLVVDPMCGIGTTLVEAAHLGRRSFGIELEDHWAELARANIAHATTRGATGHGEVLTGDGREFGDLLPARYRGEVALVVTSPPYGPSLHGRVRTRPGRGVTKSHGRYSGDPRNLGHVGVAKLLEALSEMLAACVEILRPEGLVVLTARPWRRDGELVDFPGHLQRVAENQGLIPYERHVALLAGLRDDGVVSRASFFQMDSVRKARSRGIPRLVIAHEDVLVFRRPAAR